MSTSCKRIFVLVSMLIVEVLAAPTVLAGEVQIADGDTAALLAAIADARVSGEPIEIMLAADGDYVLPAVEIAIGGTTTVDANGATLHSVLPSGDSSGEMGTQLRVDPGATVVLEETSFMGDYVGRPWLFNNGNLTLENSTIHGELAIGSTNIFPMVGPVGSGILILSEGSGSNLDMRNVTIDLGLEQPSYLEGLVVGYDYWLVNIRDHGTAALQHSTIRARQVFAGDDHFGVMGVVAEQGGAPSQVAIRNSIIFLDTSIAAESTASTIASPCLTQGNSSIDASGGNVFGESGCGVSGGVTDVSFGSFGDHGGPVPTLSLRGGSPAVNAGADAYCLPIDARGYLRGAECDAGAFELGAAIAGGGLGDKGSGGYWSAPDEGGFGFLAVSFPDSETALLVWSTFDASGHSTTVYGTGSFVDGDSIEVPEALIDLPVAGSDPVRSEAEAWGSLRLDLESCTDARFSYQTSQPGFASGSMDIGRLSVFSSVGCSELAD